MAKNISKIVKFIRVKGKVVPVYDKSIKRKALRKKAESVKRLADERIAAIRSVRETAKSIKDFSEFNKKKRKKIDALRSLIEKMDKNISKITNKTTKPFKTLSGNTAYKQSNPEAVKDFNFFLERRVNLKDKIRKIEEQKKSDILLGQGAENYVFKKENLAVKVPKEFIDKTVKRIPSADNLKGGKFSILLAEKKLAPKTFVVSTSKKTSIVQEIVKGDPFDLSEMQRSKLTRKLENLLGGSNVIVEDLHKHNVIKTKKGIKIIDTGTFDFAEDLGDKENFTKNQLKIINKFIIKNRTKK